MYVCMCVYVYVYNVCMYVCMYVYGSICVGLTADCADSKERDNVVMGTDVGQLVHLIEQNLHLLLSSIV